MGDLLERVVVRVASRDPEFRRVLTRELRKISQVFKSQKELKRDLSEIMMRALDILEPNNFTTKDYKVLGRDYAELTKHLYGMLEAFKASQDPDEKRDLKSAFTHLNKDSQWVERHMFRVSDIKPSLAPKVVAFWDEWRKHGGKEFRRLPF